jgi:hypothetical protein
MCCSIELKTKTLAEFLNLDVAMDGANTMKLYWKTRTPKLKVETLTRTTFAFSPIISFFAPDFTNVKVQGRAIH